MKTRTASLCLSTLLPVAAAVLAALPSAVLAEPVHYSVEPTHTYPSIEFPHMGISTWRGKFDRSRGAIVLDRAAGTGTVDITIDTASINFGLEAMDKAAKSDEWFDVKQYPEAHYRGTVRFDGEQPASVDGTLSFRGQEQPLTLDILSFACIPHPLTKVEICGADATGELNWSTFGMKHSEYGQGDAGKLTLRIQVEAQRDG